MNLSLSYPKVSIIILNWNGLKDTVECLKSVQKIDYPNFEIIVVDNGSTDGSPEKIKELFPEIILIRNRENLGFAKGNNIGIKYALNKYNPNYVLLLNTDIKILDKRTLTTVVEIAEQDAVAGIVGCTLIYPDGSIQFSGAQINPISTCGIEWLKPLKNCTQNCYEVELMLGAFFLIKRAVINRIGLFDEGFSPFNFEEFDYCLRAKYAGYLTKIISSVRVIHYQSQSLAKLSYWYVHSTFNKNKLRFILLNYPLPQLIIRMLYEVYLMLVYFAETILERKDKTLGVNLFNLRMRAEWWIRLQLFLDSYLNNMKNIREIIHKRNHRIEAQF